MTVVLIDGKNAVYRLGWVGRNLTDSKGRSTGAIFGLLNCLVSFRRKYPDAKFIVCWDGDARKNWRSVLFPEYKKSRREAKRTPEQEQQSADLQWQMQALRDIFALLAIPQAEDVALEADDFVGILSAQLIARGDRVVCYTNDHDYLQLVERGVVVLNSTSNPPLSTKFVQEKYGCELRDVLKVRALLGDKSDGIPRAISGVGEVSATHYVKAYKLDPSIKSWSDQPRTVRLNLAKVGPYWAIVHRNYRLMRLPHSWDDPEIPAEVQKRVKKEVLRVIKGLSPVERSQADYIAFLRLLNDFGLIQAIANRQELWSVQN